MDGRKTVRPPSRSNVTQCCGDCEGACRSGLAMAPISPADASWAVGGALAGRQRGLVRFSLFGAWRSRSAVSACGLSRQSRRWNETPGPRLPWRRWRPNSAEPNSSPRRQRCWNAWPVRPPLSNVPDWRRDRQPQPPPAHPAGPGPAEHQAHPADLCQLHWLPLARWLRALPRCRPCVGGSLAGPHS